MSELRITDLEASMDAYNGALCSLVTCGNCNLRCPYCRDWLNLGEYCERQHQDVTEVLNEIEGKIKLTNKVVVTGGEPTIYKDLPQFTKILKIKGLDVKLETNGTNPEVLKECLNHIDVVTMDIKTSFNKYRMLGATRDYSDRLNKSIDYIVDSGVVYEFKVTTVPNIVNTDDLLFIAKRLHKSDVPMVTLSKFQSDSCLDSTYQHRKGFNPDDIFKSVKIFNAFNLGVKAIS